MHLGQVLLVLSFLLLFSWLFYKGYKAYQKNGWDDPFFKGGNRDLNNY